MTEKKGTRITIDVDYETYRLIELVRPKRMYKSDFYISMLLLGLIEYNKQIQRKEKDERKKANKNKGA